MKIKIGTRGSKLALWQANAVADRLKKGGIDSEIVIIETKGDKILDVSIHKIGSKGVFTEEIEDQLAKGQIDIAVHSAKDMQSHLPEGFELLAFMEREQENDVIISHNKDFSLEDDSKEIVLGTSSTRRLALLKRYYPHVKTVPVRGNLQTRIQKMEEGACDALLLAYAGVHRMGYDDMIVHHMPMDQFITPVGQGSVAIEVYKALPQGKKDMLRQHLNHPETELRLRAERAFLRTLQGGCSVPVFGYATLADDKLTLKAGIVSLDGKRLIVEEQTDRKENAAGLGYKVGQALIAQGAGKLLAEIKKQQADDME